MLLVRSNYLESCTELLARMAANWLPASLTERDCVDFAFDLNRAVLALVDVDRLLHLRLTDHKVPVVLLVLLLQQPYQRVTVAVLDWFSSWTRVSSSLPQFVLPSVLWHCCFGGRKGIRPVKKWGDGGGGHWLDRMVCVSASVNLPLHHKVQKFSSGTGSPGWSRKRAVKWLWWWRCLFPKRPYQIDRTGFLWTRCPSCHPSIIVKHWRELKSTDPNEWPGLILSSSTTGLL